MAQSYDLVRAGEARSAVVIGQRSGEVGQRAAQELRHHVELATGVELPVIKPDEIEALPADHAIVVIGDGALAREHGVRGRDLPEEGYRIKTEGRYLIFAGRNSRYDTGNPVTVNGSPATMWAVDHFLDRHMGVRWLWPGELGTYVPEAQTITMPSLDITHQPTLRQRKMRVHLMRTDEDHRLVSEQTLQRMFDQTLTWKNRHQLGTRSDDRFGHAFTDWWDKYHEDHPELFATPPEGASQPAPRPGRVKLCVSNPAVDQMIIKEWREAGTPSSWSVAPNDSSVGWCVCEDCRAMDVPHDQNIQTIWRGNAELTARYVKFWSRLIGKMREIRPDVTIGSYAYSCYRAPPPKGVELADGIVLGVVHSYSDRRAWAEWSEAGADLFLRPNWWHMGAAAPHIPLHTVGEFFRFAQDHRMVAYDFDSLLGYWATQGTYYYMIARIGTRPSLSVDDVIDEYVSAFGAAAPAIRDYLAYWERFTDRAAYAIPAGGAVSQKSDGLYETALRHHDQHIHPISGSFKVLPMLHTDQVIGKGRQLLDRAAELAEGDQRVQQRIDFLRAGLAHLEATRDTVRLGYSFTRPDGASPEQFRSRIDELQQLRREITPDHVIWGGAVNQYEMRRRIPTTLEHSQWE